MLRRMRTRTLLFCALVASSVSAVLLACSSSDPGVIDFDGGGHDGSTATDSGHPPVTDDAGHPSVDAGHEIDSGTLHDGGHHDGGHEDAGTEDGGHDAGHHDGGSEDAGHDGGHPDGGSEDGGHDASADAGADAPHDAAHDG